MVEGVSGFVNLLLRWQCRRCIRDRVGGVDHGHQHGGAVEAELGGTAGHHKGPQGEGTGLNRTPAQQLPTQAGTIRRGLPPWGRRLSLIPIYEPTRPRRTPYAVFCLKKKNDCSIKYLIIHT